eukprot:2959002-Pyramimonas_sp.AAC.1
MAAYSRHASCLSAKEGSSASSLSLLMLGSWVILAKRKASTCVGSGCAPPRRPSRSPPVTDQTNQERSKMARVGAE